ncbi:hypothetical protein AMJ83_11560 [candidate division WOR_3 bacterium SM23_42]|uniref:Secretion system C-terminal sorting domain-containing protein n=1 Tax=candidate division WOR_3 bacterium SM23_42 TaxID=1703779 RepID=A0A0S8FN37_UNCW3|nr:MAG: hypothetical protein AMJ83_11560 [candidate division WOR_3 bacterium SM23_42]
MLGFEWSTPQLVGMSDRFSRFEMDCNDQLWCIFNDGYVVYGSYYDNSEWSDPILIYTGIQASGEGGFDVTRAQDGNLWVLTSCQYAPVSPPHITFYYNGSVWSDTFVIPGHYNFHLSADSSNRIWAVYNVGETHRIWCDVCDDTIWTGPYIVCTYPIFTDVTGACITVAPDGIRWVGGLATYATPDDLIFLTFSDSTGIWTDSLIVGPQIPGGWGFLRSIIADRTGNIWIAWLNAFENKIYAAYLDTNYLWSPDFEITQGISGNPFWVWCPLAVDDENSIWIIYDKDNTFYYRVWNGVEWSPEDTVVGPPASAGSRGDIYYDPIRKRIWVSFHASDGFDEYVFATWTSTAGGVLKYDNEDIDEAFWIFPNPANDIITITAPSEGQKDIEIIDCLGCVVKNITSDEKVIIWDGTDNLGKTIPSGIYFYRFEGGDFTDVKKMVMLK